MKGVRLSLIRSDVSERTNTKVVLSLLLGCGFFFLRSFTDHYIYLLGLKKKRGEAKKKKGKRSLSDVENVKQQGKQRQPQYVDVIEGLNGEEKKHGGREQKNEDEDQRKRGKKVEKMRRG